MQERFESKEGRMLIMNSFIDNGMLKQSLDSRDPPGLVRPQGFLMYSERKLRELSTASKSSKSKSKAAKKRKQSAMKVGMFDFSALSNQLQFVDRVEEAAPQL
jgi:hypothetical protein